MAPLPNGSAFTFWPQGALIQEFRVGGINIVQGFTKPEHYADASISSAFFGETIGRIANRLDKGEIADLDGRKIVLAKNDGNVSLHGGAVGWGKKTWDGPHTVERNGREAIRFTYVSQHGEEAYPGTVEARVWYFVGTEVGTDGIEKTVLEVEYECELVGGARETAINMTNHSYFNLGNAPTIEGTHVTLATEQYLVCDSDGIPFGTPKPHPGVVPHKEFVLGATEPDFDNCFVVNTAADTVPLDTRSLPLTNLVRTHHPDTHIHLEVYSTEPAFQFYTGKFIDIPAVDGAPARHARAGFCVEPSRYINAVNVPAWRQMTVLKRGQLYGCRNVYKAWKK